MIQSDFFTPPLPRVIAHRGGAGRRPENTLAAFDAAYAAGIRYFEFDLHTTRDGVLVICHDADLDRTTDRQGALHELPWRTVAEADAGYRFDEEHGFPWRGRGLRVPRLTDVLERFGDARFVIEIKQITPSLVAELDRHLTRSGARRRVLIASEHQPPLDEVRRMASDLPTNLSADEVRGFVRATAQGTPFTTRGQALQIPTRHERLELATTATISAAHRLGLEVHFWTVNDPREMSALLTLGADGIITDYPERLTARLAAPKA